MGLRSKGLRCCPIRTRATHVFGQDWGCQPILRSGLVLCALQNGKKRLSDFQTIIVIGGRAGFESRGVDKR